MTVLAVRVVEPAHVLTISGSDAGKVGSCRCGAWSFTGKVSSDDVSRLYLGHVADAGTVHANCCDKCQAGIATIRRGAVELCTRCAFDEDRAEALAVEDMEAVG